MVSFYVWQRKFPWSIQNSIDLLVLLPFFVCVMLHPHLPFHNRGRNSFMMFHGTLWLKSVLRAALRTVLTIRTTLQKKKKSAGHGSSVATPGIGFDATKPSQCPGDPIPAIESRSHRLGLEALGQPQPFRFYHKDNAPKGQKPMREVKVEKVWDQRHLSVCGLWDSEAMVTTAAIDREQLR